MKIAVCMKQVPEYSEGNMDPETGMLIRSGLNTRVNLCDLSALESALRLRETEGGTVTVFSMGPKIAEAVIREAYAMGADDGYLLCDPAFAGADILATSYTLMRGIRSVDVYDLILFGRQTTDGGTSFVAGAVAWWMQLPYLANVRDIMRTGGKLHVCYGWDTVEFAADIPLPCALSVEREAYLPRIPSLKRRMEGKKIEVKTRSARELAPRDNACFGTKGSATRVKRIYAPEIKAKNRMIQDHCGESAVYLADVLASYMTREE